MLILWNVLDVDSKRLAATEHVAKMSYGEMAKWIDNRYRVKLMGSRRGLGRRSILGRRFMRRSKVL